MPVTTQQLRYQLPKKAIKADCPQCGQRYRKTLSRYVDTRTGETLPESYGRCDRESNCGYHLSPYQKTASDVSYADEVYRHWKDNNASPIHKAIIPSIARQQASSSRIYSIPDEVFKPSLGHYEQNQFACLLVRQFGITKASELLQQFQIGTSKRWPGACVFWYIDERSRVRGGQIKLFADDWHTAKYIDREGRTRAKVDWVHTALKYRLEKAEKSLPEWLQAYIDNSERSPCLFGLPQLATAPKSQPVAIVEAPKTAVACSALIPGFVWLAAGALSYLNAERLSPLRSRKVMLYPDLSSGGNAFARWNKVASELNTQGFTIQVSDHLETVANDEQRQAGLDLADFLLDSPATVSTIAEQLIQPGSILKPKESQLERLVIEPINSYPAEWDEPSPPGAKPKISAKAFHEWQCQHIHFGQLGLASLEPKS